MMRMVEELRLAARRLARESGFTCRVILTMAVGIGVVAAVFAPLPYLEPDRLVAFVHVVPGTDLTRDGPSAGIYLHYRDENRVFGEIAGYERVSFTALAASYLPARRASRVHPAVALRAE